MVLHIFVLGIFKKIDSILKKVLYVSYDGMTDPLGQGQVINYLIGLSKKGFCFDILSSEKDDHFEKEGKYIQQLLTDNNINWFPLKFHTKPPLVSKLLDKYLLLKKAKELYKQNNYAFIHCRSYLGAEIGLKLKKEFGVKYLFDMRGFWPDEKIDAKHWDQSKLFWRIVYKKYKKIEKKLLINADEVISLTYAAKKEIETKSLLSGNKLVNVIPCCTDTDKYYFISDQKRQAAKQLLNINKDAYVVGYLGSMSVLYMIPELVKIFAIIKKLKPTAMLLVISKSDPELILKELDKNELNKNDVMIKAVSFKDVPDNLAAFDISISLKSMTYGNIGTSPVKLGECLCSGIPVISSDGVGDVTQITERLNAGYIIKGYSKNDFEEFSKAFDMIEKIDRKELSEKAIEFYSLCKGVSDYEEVYKKLIG